LSQYEFVRTSGDANLLMMFLAHFPHCHVGLLQLAVVYARLGSLEKAVDLTGRALYAFECAALEAFRPWGIPGANSGNGRSGGSTALPCWLDTAAAPSVDYCAALMLHANLCSALGCHSVAAEVGRYLLSVGPSDCACVLLVLDTLLLSAGNYNLLQGFCGGVVGLERCDGPQGCSTAELWQVSFRSRFRLGLQPTEPTATAEEAGRGLEHLPNWSYSLALSWHLQHRRPDRSATAEGHTATLLLKTALLRWPFALHHLLSSTAADLSAGGCWAPLLRHALFHRAEER
jgi:hypothetical protein